MDKKKVWKIGCYIMLFLAVCTVLSAAIKDLMMPVVRTTEGVRQNGVSGEELRLPVSALQQRGGFYVVQSMEEVPGKFGGDEFRVREQEIVILEEDGEAFTVSAEQLRQSNAGNLQIIYDWVYPVCEGEEVHRETEALEELYDDKGRPRQAVHEEYLKSFRLAALGIGLLPWALLLLKTVAGKLQRFHAGEYREGWKGALMFMLFLAALYFSMGKLRIPRQCLPEKHIFDLMFYGERIAEIWDKVNGQWVGKPEYGGLRALYLKAFGIYGGIIAVCWIMFLVLWKRRKERKR